MEAHAALYDVAIVGGGIMGSCAAWRAAAAGLSVLLLEKSPSATHAEGSSHGHSRIVRRTYLQPSYARLMNLAYPLWDELSRLAGCGPLRAYPSSAAPADDGPPPLVRHTGGLSLVHKGSAAHAGLLAACASAGVAVSEVSAQGAAERWGLVLPASTVVVLEAGDTGAAVGAGRCVAAAQAAAVAQGAVLRLGAEVTGITLAPATAQQGGPTAALALRCGARVLARRVVLCPGAWAAPLLEGALGLQRPLPLQPLLCSTAYFRLRDGSSSSSSGGGSSSSGSSGSGGGGGGAAAPVAEPLPVLIDWRAEDGRGVYGVPATGWGPEGEAFRGAFKFAIHAGTPTTAAGRPWLPDAAVTVAPVTAWVAQHAPRFDPTPIAGSTTTCLYTMTPDEDFVLDEVPVGGAGGLALLCAGFSGHGFKFGPLVGEIAAQWARASLQGSSAGSGAAAASPLCEVEAWLQRAAAEAAGVGSSASGGGAPEPLLERFALRRAALQAT
jgi:sarcosine oxidase/L-pipecolate oxidase